MKKGMLRALLLWKLVCLLALPGLAVDTGALERALPPAARTILGDAAVEDVLAGENLFRRIWDRGLALAQERLSDAARSAAVTLTVTLLCSVAGALHPSGKTPEYALLGGALAIMGVCAGDIRSFLSETRNALEELADFSRALLPCVAAASAAAGSAASGAARYTVAALFLDILMTAGRDTVLPMIYAYAALSTADAALPEGALGGPVKLLSWLCRTALTVFTTVFTLLLSLSGGGASSGRGGFSGRGAAGRASSSGMRVYVPRSLRI